MKFHAFARAGRRAGFISFNSWCPTNGQFRARTVVEEIEERIRYRSQSRVFVHIEPISDPASYDDEGWDRMVATKGR